MKLIIDIPDRIYKINQNRTLNITDAGILEKAVRNSTPLDDVKAEIKEKCDNINHITSHLPYSTHRFVQELLCEILESIDNAESEDK